MKKLMFAMLLLAGLVTIVNPAHALSTCVQGCAAAMGTCQLPYAAIQKDCRAACPKLGVACRHRCTVSYRASIKPCLADSHICITACARK